MIVHECKQRQTNAVRDTTRTRIRRRVVRFLTIEKSVNISFFDSESLQYIERILGRLPGLRIGENRGATRQISSRPVTMSTSTFNYK